MALQIVIKNPKGEGFIHPIGFPTGFTVPNIYTLFHSSADILTKLGERNTANVFYTLGHHGGLGQGLPSRKKTSFEYQNILAFDIDHADTSRPYDYVGVVSSILTCAPGELTCVNSGNGFHVLANLKTAIKSAKQFDNTKPAYNELCFVLQTELEKKGLSGKVDPVIYEPARLLRLPGTLNVKPGQPDKECLLVELADTQLDLDLMALSGLDQIEKQNIAPANVRRMFPRPDFAEMVKECDFVKKCIEDPSSVHEPQYFDLVSLLAAQDPASKITHAGKEYTGVELAEHVFDRAVESKSLAGVEFQSKWEASSRYGARKCSTIASNWIGVCSACPHRDKIPTPLALKSAEHVGSAETGYWVMTTKGTVSRPHYGDLSKVYSQESAFVATQEARILTFEKSHYAETTENNIRAWVERKVTPSDPLMHMHCNEFVRKIQRTGAVSTKQEDELFNKSILGKLNCKNGTLDIRSGELTPHSPKNGFMYTLPYDYLSDETSEEFMTWLHIVTKNRPELIESLLDMMAYIFWPNYDDHAFIYLVGEGRNGKSTILDIIAALVGEQNYSSVSIQQLGSNRFAPAALEGKLVNICEESSGYELSLEEMNVIKNLSAGGKMNIERKNQQGFEYVNKAKLIFSANKPPRFKEAGVALTSRMIVIPFDHYIVHRDPTVGKMLIADAPKILSMLVRRIQENVKNNGGFFRVSRGGEAARVAQKKMLMGGNSATEWGLEMLESNASMSNDSHVLISDAYYRYNQWCDRNGYGKMNKNNFANAVYTFILPTGTDKEDNRVSMSGKQVRVFKKCRMKEEVL